jgi:glycosyltransferase involved in cell wall biosynthesis
VHDNLPRAGFVVATKDRPNDLRKMLQSLSDQSIHPEQIIIVDASEESVKKITVEFRQLNIKYIRHPWPSASIQRNIGIKAIDPDIELIGFLDDDIVFEAGAMEKMLAFWRQAPEDVGGCAFNLKNPVLRSELALKRSPLADRLGIYSRKKGVVMPSGWHTLTGTVPRTTFVQWLPSGASIWRKNIFEKFWFDEYFDGYSYLEDLDFSFSVGKSHRLAVVAEAGFYHYPSPFGRISHYRFGEIEVENRLYFVKKHNLSVPRCYLGLFLRLLMSLMAAMTGESIENLHRVAGNCTGLFQSLLPGHITFFSNNIK